MAVILSCSETEDLITYCPECNDGQTRVVGVDGRWICQKSQHASAMETLEDAVAEEVIEWRRFEALLEVACSDQPIEPEAKRALGDQMIEHLKRGKYLAWVISQRGGVPPLRWWP